MRLSPALTTNFVVAPVKFKLCLPTAICDLIDSVPKYGAGLLLTQDQEATFGSFGAGANIPMVILLPVLGVMSVTGEWTQRTAMVTFALVPSRGRVVAAKYVSALVIAVLASLNVW